ncbi:uncharacterized protein LOC129596609 [Paramacrobiotus metropolitanus]|uniref:uncharacterized protein LOC129596609 n=1 Tax=Paramacrobiotus metropolitanus TaxID=2943436 RepID=UPI002445AAF4|nr:uncharacterized protein LOC129596609 [Paramacrobiotus metropolitanus]
MADLLTAEEFQRTLSAIHRPAQPQQFPLLQQAIEDAEIGSRAELALFLANVYHDSDGLQRLAEKDNGKGKEFDGGYRYYGRGYLQIAHIYSYRDASEAVLGDELILEKRPERVEKEPQLAWDVAAWVWRERVKPYGTATLEDTVRSLNSDELDGDRSALRRRKQFLRAINKVLQPTADAGEEACPDENDE